MVPDPFGLATVFLLMIGGGMGAADSSLAFAPSTSMDGSNPPTSLY